MALILIVISAASCYAAPVNDYSLGRLKLDADAGFSSFSPSYGDSQIGYDASVTAGLGFGFAGQYSYSNSKVGGDNDLKNHQISLYDHIFGPVGIFVGASRTVTRGANPQNGIVFGVTGSMPIAPKTSAYAILGAGNHVSGREFGIGYELSKNADLQLFYRKTKYTGLNFANGDSSATLAGFFSSISYKL